MGSGSMRSYCTYNFFWRKALHLILITHLLLSRIYKRHRSIVQLVKRSLVIWVWVFTVYTVSQVSYTWAVFEAYNSNCRFQSNFSSLRLAYTRFLVNHDFYKVRVTRFEFVVTRISPHRSFPGAFLSTTTRHHVTVRITEHVRVFQRIRVKKMSDKVLAVNFHRK